MGGSIFITNKFNTVAIVRSIEFVYRSKKYYALVRKAATGVGHRLYVRIMNSELENLWVEHQVVILEDGKFRLEKDIPPSQMKELRESIFQALAQNAFAEKPATQPFLY